MDICKVCSAMKYADYPHKVRFTSEYIKKAYINMNSNKELINISLNLCLRLCKTNFKAFFKRY